MQHINFALILVLAVFITGIITLLEKIIFAPKRRKLQLPSTTEDIQTSSAKTPAWIAFCQSIFPILFLVLIFRSFLFEPYQIPSGSMIPTLHPGDFILVNKFDYGLRLPVTGHKIVSVNKPKRGDVMVFKFPENPNINYIKRVVGLPGDHIRYENKLLYINDKLVINKHTTVVSEHEEDKKADQKNDLTPTFYDEQLGKHNFKIKIYPDISYDNGTRWTVPKGMYFVMGDNRDRSYDSRFWGFVPEENIVGKAIYVWMHWLHWYQLPKFSRNQAIP